MIRSELKLMKHREAVRYFNLLLIDLNKALLGFKYEPITPERLKEGSKHIRDIQACTRPVRVCRNVKALSDGT